MIYCPYTDREMPRHETNSEHIIPLALGGLNGFEIHTDAAFNSKLGSELDGSLANDFMWAIRRTMFDARGHSGKEPVATIKHATYGQDKRAAQVHFHQKKGLRIWDVRDRKFKNKVNPIQISTTMNFDLPIRFTAKVALAAGYYVYGNLFREYVDHRQLRDMMNIDPAKIDRSKGRSELDFDHITAQCDDWMRVPTGLDSRHLLIRQFCSSVNGSVVVIMIGRDHFSVGVGLLGHYLAMVSTPAETENFPKTGGYTGGRVMALVNKQLKRCSWADALLSCVDVFGKSQVSEDG